jgi:hypothetical protein
MYLLIKQMKSWLQEPVLHLDMSTTQWPELRCGVSGQQVPVLLLDVSAHVCLRLQHLSEQHEPVLLMEVSNPQVSELHFSVSGQQEPSASPSLSRCGYFLLNSGLELARVRIQKELISYLMCKNEEIRGKRLGRL